MRAVGRWLWRGVLAFLCLLFPLFALRLLWQRWPNRATACVFFVPGFFSIVWLSVDRFPHEPLVNVLLAIGVLCNGAVIIRNEGRMPVVGMRVRRYPRSAWVKAGRRHRWLWLADQKALLFFSVGDLFVLAGIVLALVS